jgi:fructokinase
MDAVTILSLGEILWDVFPDGREDLGGAPFNLAFHASRLGHDAIFVSAVGEDTRGSRAIQKASKLGIDTSFIQTNTSAPTGLVSVSLDGARQPSFVLERPAAYDHVALSDRWLEKLAAADPDWICFGTLFFLTPANLSTLRRLLAACPKARRFYDVNLREGNWNDALVRELVPLADIVKLNEAEETTLGPAVAAARGPVCVTLADRGCRVGGVLVAGYPVEVADAVGAGDAFSAGLIHGLSEGLTPLEAADFANRVGAIVASHRGATPFWKPEDAFALTR